MFYELIKGNKILCLSEEAFPGVWLYWRGARSAAQAGSPALPGAVAVPSHSAGLGLRGAGTAASGCEEPARAGAPTQHKRHRGAKSCNFQQKALGNHLLGRARRGSSSVASWKPQIRQGTSWFTVMASGPVCEGMMLLTLSAKWICPSAGPASSWKYSVLYICTARCIMWPS